MSDSIPTLRYFPVPVRKFVVLSLLSLGFYELYWFYRNWAYIRARDGSRISPVLRTIFQPFTFTALMADIRSNLGAGPSRLGSIVLAIVFFALSIVGLFPDPYWLPGMFTFVCFLPVVRLIRDVNGADAEYPPYGWTLRNWAFVAVAGPCVAGFVASTIALIPSSQIVPGWMVWGPSARFLATSGVVAPGERILYFYSGGMFSFADDGNILTDRRVISYETDPETGELVVEKAEFAEINFTKHERGGWFNPTVLTIVREDGSDFVLHLSTGEDRDRDFIERFQRLRADSQRGKKGQPKLEA